MVSGLYRLTPHTVYFPTNPPAAQGLQFVRPVSPNTWRDSHFAAAGEGQDSDRRHLSTCTYSPRKADVREAKRNKEEGHACRLALVWASRAG